MGSILPSNEIDQPEETSTQFIVTNGIGSYSNLTTRHSIEQKTQGLLVLYQNPQEGRITVWDNCQESMNGHSIEPYTQQNTQLNFSHSEYQPEKSDTNSNLPTWLINIDGNVLKKTITMEPEKQTTLIKYTLISSSQPSVLLQLKNFISFYHQSEPGKHDSSYRVDSTHHTVNKNNISLRLACQTPGPLSTQQTHWTDEKIVNSKPPHNEGEASYNSHASICIQSCKINLYVGESCYMVGTTEESWPFSTNVLQKSEANQHCVYSLDHFANDLSYSALQFIVLRGAETLFSGFPNFNNSGRDTLISLPGITLATGHFDIAKKILLNSATYLNAGMLPNKLPGINGDRLQYDTMDTTLLFFWSIQQYLEETQDWAFIEKELFIDLKEIIRHHIRGTRHGIGIDQDGLLKSGDIRKNLTWSMQRTISKEANQRPGKAIEINALWYNALCFTKECCEKFNESSASFDYLIPIVQKNMNSTFWNDSAQCCYDHTETPKETNDIRPSQIIAISLPYSAFTIDKQEKIFDAVYKKLYTPLGLRSLNIDSPNYLSQPKNDYDSWHRGVIWPFLMGPFIDALMKVKKNKALAEKLLSGLKNHFYNEAGIRGISEAFEGDTPFRPIGNFNQAASIAECLRVIKKYKLNVKLPAEQITPSLKLTE